MRVGDCILTVAGMEKVSHVTDVLGEGVYTIVTMEVRVCNCVGRGVCIYLCVCASVCMLNVRMY